MFGGDIRRLAESDEDGVLNPDFEWNGKLWDLKTPTTTTMGTLDKRLRYGLKQIESNPGGGLMLDISKNSMSLAEAENMVTSILEKRAKER